MIPLRDANPTRRSPLVTPALIGACFAAFAVQLWVVTVGGEQALEDLLRTWGLVPASATDAIRAGKWLSPAVLAALSAMFLHGGWAHILGNMLFLWIFGGRVESRMGRLGFLAFYLVGGLDPTSNLPMIGASGAISAILGAYLVLYPRARIQSLVFLGFFYQLIAVPAVLLLGYWFLLQVIDGLASLGSPDLTGGVAVYAHITGFVVGALIALPLRGRRSVG